MMMSCDVVIISHDNSAHRMAPEEIRDAVMRLEAETFRDGYIVHKPEPRAVEGMVAALRAERFARPLSMGYSTRRTKVRSQRCIRCNAIVPEGQRCPQCGGKRTQ
jgi:rRNA maturation endonuclease Nob1